MIPAPGYAVLGEGGWIKFSKAESAEEGDAKGKAASKQGKEDGPGASESRQTGRSQEDAQKHSPKSHSALLRTAELRWGTSRHIRKGGTKEKSSSERAVAECRHFHKVCIWSFWVLI